MNDTCGPTHDKENGLLAVKSSPRPGGRDAATQTPQMTRHHTPTRTKQARASSPGSSSSEESLTYEDSISFQPSARNVEMSRVMPIPDVVIEHSNDTYPLTHHGFNSGSQERPFGFTNLAFEGKDEMVRSSSTGNFRQRDEAYHAGDPIFLQQNQHLYVPNNPSDPHSASLGNVDRRHYYSLPKSSRRKHKEKDVQLHSQPPTPQMMRERVAAAVGTDDSTFWMIPRAHSSNSINNVSAEASKYAPTDSVAGLYSISGRSTVVSNGFSEPVIGLYEMHQLPPVGTPVQSTPRSVRKFEFTKMPASVDQKRRRLQCCTDSLSLLLMIPGILIALATPALIVPLFYVTPKLFIPQVLIFMASGTMSVVFLSFSGIAGNIVWYYDENRKKLRPRLHCGKGPTFHFWGNAFYSAGVEQKQKEINV